MRPPPPAFRALMAKREPQIILKTDERKIHLELGLEGKFAAKSTGWDEKRVFLGGDKLEVSVKHGPLGAHARPGGAAAGQAGPALLPGRLSCGGRWSSRYGTISMPCR
jgi:hypothetical protein